VPRFAIIIRTTSENEIEVDSPPRLEIRLLGGFRVSLGGEVVRGFESQKVRALLALLACHPHRELTREQLADLLWPDSEPDAGRRNLRQALYNLRKGLGARGREIIDGGGGQVAVRMRLDDHDFLDVAAFLAAWHRGLPGSDEVVAGELVEAVQLYEGDFLAGFLVRDSPRFEDWLVAEQERLRDAAVQSLRALVDHFSARGEFSTATRYCRRLLAIDPMSEEAHREMMRLYVLAGARRRALSHYTDLVALLDRELGVEPMPETRALHTGILSDDLPAGAEARSKSPPSQPAGPFVPLVGRAGALDELSRSWRRATGHRAAAPGPRLALVEGEPGVGKSRLLRTFLNQVSSRPDTTVVQGRSWLPAPWHGGEPFASVLQGLRTRLLADGDPPVEAAADAMPTVATLGAAVEGVFRAASAPVVLNLDTLHLASAAAAGVVAGLLDACAGRPMWIVATCQPAELASGGPLHALAQRADVDRLLLARLEDDDIVEICRSLVGTDPTHLQLAGHLFRASEGLPLAVVESINSLCDLGLLVPASRRRWSLQGTPPAVEATGAELERLVVERVERLPTSARRLLTLAAVIGPSFDVELLQRAAHEHIGVVEIAIETLLERWLLRPYARRWSKDPRERDLVLWAQGARRGGFEFAHRLLHRAVYHGLPDDRRRALHRQVADILAERHGPDGGDRPERIAFHYLEGSAGEAALPFVAAAAERALAMDDEDTAARLVERGRILLERPSIRVGDELAERWRSLRRRAGADPAATPP